MDKNINIIISAIDKATAPIKKLGANMSNFAEKNKQTFETMRNVWVIAWWVVVAWLSKAVDAASDLWESMNAVNVVFKEGSEELHNFWKESAKTVWLSTRAFNELATPVGAMLQNLWYWAKEASKETIKLAKRAADMASVFNVDVSEAMWAIQAGLRGEADPLERFGVSLNDASIKAYALSSGLIDSEREMTASEKATARLWLLYEQTAKLEWDFANTSWNLANSKRILSAQITNVSAQLWTALLPAINSIMQVITPLVTRLAERAINNPELMKTITMITLALLWLITVIGTLWLAIPSIITWLTALKAAFVFIGWPITVLITLIGVLVYQVVKNWDTIKRYTIYMVDSVKKTFTDMYNSVKATFEQIRLVIVLVWEGIKASVSYIIDSMIDWIKNEFKGVADFISNTVWAISRMWDKVGNIGSGIKSGISGLISGQRALWGTVMAGKSYLVWERWPEIYTPATTGRIQQTPSNSMWVNINLWGVVINNAQDENRLIQKMKTALMEESRKFNLWIVA